MVKKNPSNRKKNVANMVRNLALVEKGRSKPQNNRINNKMKPQSGVKADAALAQYAAACLYPFSEEAIGARVPMPYEVRTRTTHLLTPYKCVVPSTGVFDAIITPNAAYTLTSNYGTWSGGVNNPLNYTASGNGAVANYIAGNSTIANMSAIYSNHRIVAMGVRIKSNSNYTVTQGRIFVAVVPALPAYPSLVTNGTASAAGFYNALGCPCDTSYTGAGGGIVSSSIVSYPVSAEFAMSDLMEEGGVTIRVPKTSSRHQDFIGEGTVGTGYGWDLTAPTSTAGLAAGGLSVVYANGGANTALNGSPGVDPSWIQTSGHSSVFIRGDGMSSSQVVEVEVIMHFEGEVAATNTVASGGLTPIDDSALCAYGTSVDVDRVNLAVSKSQQIKLGGPMQEPVGRAMLRELGVGAVRTVLAGTLGPVAGVVGGYAAKKVLGLMM